MKIKTIDVNAKEWFDKVNGNSYFSAIITLNFGMKDSATINISFEYGYGDYFTDRAKQVLVEQGYIKAEPLTTLWRYCQENNIILRTSKHENCKKRDVLNFAS